MSRARVEALPAEALQSALQPQRRMPANALSLAGISGFMPTWSVSASCCCSSLHLAREKQADGGDRQHDADEGEGVAKAHDKGLTLDDIAERHDRLMLRGGRVGDAVRQEV